ncbi:MAG: methyltransferase type 11, partial [Acidobacteriota bacterium]
CEIQRVLRPGGLFVLQLSAFERLRGAHDESVHQARRYTRRQVTDLLEGAGFEVLLARYRLAFMPPLMVLNNLLARLRARTGATREPDIALPSTLPNNILGAAARLDWWLGTLIPWGSSVFCVARRLSSSETGLR